MSTSSWIAFACFGALALLDWIAVARKNKPLEYVTKPGALLALIVVALLLEPEDGGRAAFFVAALCLSLAGDIFLMMPRDMFIAGLASFLWAHVAYIVGFMVGPYDWTWDIVSLVPLLLLTGVIAHRVLAALAERRPQLRVPVLAYALVITVMVASAWGSTEGVAIAGASLFYLSDGLIGWTRFVEPLRWGPLAIIVTYHLGQALLVLSLLG